MTEVDLDRLARRRRASDRLVQLVGRGLLALFVFVLLLPAVLIVVLSFSGDPVFRFPPASWGLRQYRTLFAEPVWGDALWLSFRIAIASVALSALVAVPAALAVARSRLPGRDLLQALGVTPLIVPISAYAVAMYGVFAQFRLIGTIPGLIIANAVLAMPLMLIVVAAALTRIPVALELAAMTAGASRRRAWTGVTLRLLTPAILAGGVLAFITSFDEAVFISFLGGPGQTTLPKAIFDSVRFGVDPVITAIATLLMVATSGLMLVALKLRRT